MVACLADPGLLEKIRWSGASFVTRADDTHFEVRPGCPFLVTVGAGDDRYGWPLEEVEGVLAAQGVGGVEGRAYFVCDRSDERYSSSSRGYRALSKVQVKGLGAWLGLAGGKEKLLSDFVDLQFSVLRKKYRRDTGMGCWVAEDDSLRVVAFVNRIDGDADGDITIVARSVRVAQINASEASLSSSQGAPGPAKSRTSRHQ